MDKKKILVIGHANVGTTCISNITNEPIFTEKPNIGTIDELIERETSILIKNTHQFEDFYSMDSTNKGKASKIFRNKQNPNKIKSKYIGRTNPLKKK